MTDTKKRDQITAHIKLDDRDWIQLGRLAENQDMTTAQLVRKILAGWIDQQVIIAVSDWGPETAQYHGHRGFNPSATAELMRAAVAEVPPAQRVTVASGSNHWQNWVDPAGQ